MNAQMSVSKESIGAFCRKHGIRRLAVFGSALDDFGPASDRDVLVEFAPDRVPGLLGVAGMEAELSRLFLGRKVDLRTPEDLIPYFRQDVLDTAEVQYARRGETGTVRSSGAVRACVDTGFVSQYPCVVQAGGSR